MDLSNRFYTMIPHRFGHSRPPAIDTTDAIAMEMEMLEHLANIKLTYSLLSESGDKLNPLDYVHEQLNANIQPLSRNSTDYADVERYLMQTHDNFANVDIIDVFEVTRHGEQQRFEAFKNFSNRTLLWHGSGLSNYVGILTNGLKIAPPDALAHGARFGKGLYFADAFAKSVHYSTLSDECVGLLLLCEVALGSSKQVTDDGADIKLKAGEHSVKYMGDVEINGFKIRADGLLIPDGMLPDDEEFDMDFCEYIVYNEAQVRIKYLVMIKITDH